MNDIYNNLVMQVNNIPVFWFIILAFALFAAVLWLIFSLFKDLRTLRIIINTPTSKIRSAAQGYVELQGKVTSVIELLESPLTKTKCCWYKYKVEKEVITQDSDGNTTYEWEVVDEGQSYNLLKINDETGECLINVTNAIVKPIKHQVWIGHAMSNPNPQRSTKRINKLFEMLSNFDNTRYKYTEYLIEPEEVIYTLGFFQTVEKHFVPSVKSINTEWQFYADKIQDHQRINYLSHKKDPCIVSTYSQKHLIKKYKSGIFLSGFGAIVATVLLSGFLYLRSVS